MDKKNTLIGIALLVAAFGLMLYTSNNQPAPRPQPVVPTPNEGYSPTPGQTAVELPDRSIGPAAAAGDGDANATPAPVVSLHSQPGQPTGMFASLAPERRDEQFTTLGNEFIEVRFTNYGGAIADVALLRHRARPDGTDDPLVLNAERHAPILALARLPGADLNSAYQRSSLTHNQVVYRTVVGGQLEIIRTYSLSSDADAQDPYVIRNETVIRNLSGAPLPGGRLALNLGTARKVHESDDGTYLQAGRFDGDKLRLNAIRELSDEGFFSSFGMSTPRPLPYIESPGSISWATVENQFFATIITLRKPGTNFVVRRVDLGAANGTRRPDHGLTAEMHLEAGTLASGASESLAFDIYTGPKEFHRLERLGQQQDKVMQWWPFAFISKLLLTLMTAIHGLVAGSGWAWGWAIILTTVVIRTLMWPLTGMSTRAAKRMAKISGPLKELQEKYKDNRQKLTEETMKLWKEHKVNPVAGCLPILLQMPIFIGLFSMLRSAAELRFAEFLWVGDLSAPDTIAYIPGIGIPINPMPILMGVTSMVQMRMTPTPTTDNPSAKMMKFMPIMFVVLCYNFSSGLSLYWTFSNIFSIFQQWVTNRQKDPVDTAPVKPGAADRAKPVKDAKVSNVRNGKKKK